MGIGENKPDTKLFMNEMLLLIQTDSDLMTLPYMFDRNTFRQLFQ